MTPKDLSRRSIPVTWIVPAIFILLVMVLAAASGFALWNSYKDALERARVRVTTSAQVVSTHIEWQIAASLRILHDADRLAGSNPVAGTIDSAGLDSLLQFMPKGMSLMLVDPDGHILSSTSSQPHDLNGVDIDEIRKLNGNDAWYISPADTVGAAEDRSFMIAKRLERDGKFVGGAVLRVPVTTMTDLWASLNLGPGSTVGLLRSDGWLVARFPMPDEPVNLSNYILFTDYLKKSPAGVYDAESPLDGAVRLVGYRTVRNGPLIITASASRDYALVQFWKQVYDLLLLLVPLIVSLAALTIWVVRLLRQDEQMRAGLSAALERNKLLMGEIHHRIKNNLQSVASLVKLQPISNEAKTSMSDRIAAMSAVHELAYSSEQYDETNLTKYLTLLIDNLARSARPGIDVTKTLDSVAIDRDLAQPLGLVVNEVVSNSIKHAFPGNANGHIDIRLAMKSASHAELVVRDDGAGYDASGNGSGMGSRLIRAFAQQLGSDYEYGRDNGTVFAIRFPARPVAGS